MKLKEKLNSNILLIKAMLENEDLLNRVESSIDLIVKAVNEEKPLLVCGNGGSAADAQHITGELVGRFLKERKAINAICLSSNTAAITAWANDYSYETIFARQVEAHAKKGGVLFAISTSGNSKNIIEAINMARQFNVSVIGLTGKGGGKMSTLCDFLLDVPSIETPRVQELHLILYHYICEEIEKRYHG